MFLWLRALLGGGGGGGSGGDGLFVVELVVGVVVLAVLDVLGRLAEARVRIVDVAGLAAAEARVAVLEALEEEAAVVVFGEAQMVTEHQLGGVSDRRAREAENLFGHAAGAQRHVGEFTDRRLNNNNDD